MFRARLEYISELYFYISLIITSSIAYILWAVFFRPRVVGSADFQWIDVASNVLKCIIVGSIFLFIEKFVLQLAAVSFHRKSYAERVVRSKFEEYVLERLWEARRSTKHKKTTSAGPGVVPWWRYVQRKATSSSSLGNEDQDSFASMDQTDQVETDMSDEDLLKSRKEKSAIEKTKKMLSKPFNFVNAVSEVTGVNAIMRQTKGVLQDVTNAALTTLINGASSETGKLVV